MSSKHSNNPRLLTDNEIVNELNHHHHEIEEMEEFNEVVTKLWEKEKKKLVSHIQEIHKIQERFVEKTYKSLR